MIDKSAYVYVKLTSGEQVLATLISEDEYYIEILFPILIKSIPVVIDNRNHERIVSSPFCQFTDDKIFMLPKTSVMFIKELSETFLPHYTNLVEEAEVPKQDIDELEKEERVFIDGNDTVH